MTTFDRDLADVMEAARKEGLTFTEEEVRENFGLGTYRWLIEQLGVNYIDGMDIGLFTLHQDYDREYVV